MPGAFRDVRFLEQVGIFFRPYDKSIVVGIRKLDVCMFIAYNESLSHILFRDLYRSGNLHILAFIFQTEEVLQGNLFCDNLVILRKACHGSCRHTCGVFPVRRCHKLVHVSIESDCQTCRINREFVSAAICAGRSET